MEIEFTFQLISEISRTLPYLLFPHHGEWFYSKPYIITHDFLLWKFFGVDSSKEFHYFYTLIRNLPFFFFFALNSLKANTDCNIKDTSNVCIEPFREHFISHQPLAIDTSFPHLLYMHDSEIMIIIIIISLCVVDVALNCDRVTTITIVVIHRINGKYQSLCMCNGKNNNIIWRG